MNRWLRCFQLVPVPVLRGPARGALWTLYPYSSYWRKGGAEPVTERAILSLGQLAGRTCWDLGAHFGFYSLVFAKLVGPTGQVVAFEPDPVSFRRLQLHARMNRLRNMVAFEAAAGSTSHVAKLVVNHGQGATTSHLPYPGEQVESTSAVVQINCLRLDELVEARRIRPPDVIKLDVEGHGFEALSGAEAAIRATKPAIIASIHSPQEAEGVRRVLEPLGYTCRALDEAKAGAVGWEACPKGGEFLLTVGAP